MLERHRGPARAAEYQRAHRRADPTLPSASSTAVPSMSTTTTSWATLEYRSACASRPRLLEGVENWQGNAVVNYTEPRRVPFTRIIEHKHFEFGKDEAGQMLPDTVITREYPADWEPGDEPYYPMNDETQQRALRASTRSSARQEGKRRVRGAPGRRTSTTTWTRPSTPPSTW